MDLLRSGFDNFYSAIKPIVFNATKKDPEVAHKLFVSFLNTLYNTGTDNIILQHSSNDKKSSIELSNAAGFNKNAEISPSTMEYLGFERSVIGTVTSDSWEGNPRPRIIRYPSSQSLINWMGLPGDGAEAIAERLMGYKSSNIPLTINLMSTPQKQGDALLRDLEKTILTLRGVPSVDRFELNISCPNTHSVGGRLDARSEYQNQLEGMIDVVESNIHKEQILYLKISPDLSREGVQEIFSAIEGHNVKGVTSTNTTTNHSPNYIAESPKKGGASGDAVYSDSVRVQDLFAEAIKTNNSDLEIIACGGINSIKKAEERIEKGAKEIQIYTPIIFSGPKILREFRTHFQER
ncbi:MAG: hypothetical protein V1888_00900 [archaeon]